MRRESQLHNGTQSWYYKTKFCKGFKPIDRLNPTRRTQISRYCKEVENYECRQSLKTDIRQTRVYELEGLLLKLDMPTNDRANH